MERQKERKQDISKFSSTPSERDGDCGIRSPYEPRCPVEATGNPLTCAAGPVHRIGRPRIRRLEYLPDTLRTPATPPNTTFRHSIVVGPDSARVELTWTAFHRGPGHFLANVSARLVQPVHYDSISLGQVSELKNVGSKFEPVESAKIGIGWYKKRFFVHRAGVTPFRFDANGTNTVWPAMGQ